MKIKWQKFDKLELNIFSAIVASTTMFIHEIFENLNGNPSSSMKLGVFMLLRISKQQNRKSRKFLHACLELYIVTAVSPTE